VVVLTSQWTASDWWWGAGQILRAWQALGQGVAVVISGVGEALAQEWAEQAGVEVVRLRVRGFWDWHGLRQLGRWLQQRGVPVVLGQGAEAVGLALAARASGPRKAFAVVALEALPTGFGLRTWLLARAVRRADAVLLPTRAAAAPYLRLGVPSDRLSWIAPVAEPFPSRPGPEASPLRLPPSAQVLLHFCTRDDDAGARQAIVIHDILRYNRPHLHLLVVAASEVQRQRLAAFARQLAFDDLRVHVLHAGEAGGWPGSGKLVLITSPHRSPAVAATALAQGAAVAGWQMPELAEMLGDDLAVGLATEGKTAELAERVRRLLDDPALLAAQTEAARQRAVHYTWQRMQSHLQGLYNDLQRMKVTAADDLSGSSRPTLSAHR
jgi:hypothetical protein